MAFSRTATIPDLEVSRAVTGRTVAALALLAVLPVSPVALEADIARSTPPICEPFSARVARIVPAPAQYRDFCARHPAECEASGSAVVALTPDMWNTLVAINRAVNEEIVFVPDPEECGFEDFWDLPTTGYGDCEDFSLEKRRRLAEAGLPRAAMRMAIVQHQTRLFSHAVLTIDTTRGALVLDDLRDDVICWNDALLNFEMRENADGTWSRFDHSLWPMIPFPELLREGARPGSP